MCAMTISIIWKTGNILMDGYQKLSDKYKLPTKAIGWGPHPVFSFKDEKGNDDLPLKSLFLQETAKAGILTNCKNFTSYAHEESDIQWVLEKFDGIFKIMADAITQNKVEALLEGPIVRARYVRS